MARRIKRPAGFPPFPSDAAKTAAGKPPKRFRRVRVVAEANTPGGVYPPVRDVYLESCTQPLMVTGATLFDGTGIGDYSNTTCEMMNVGVPVELVADMVRFFESLNVVVRYEPPGNMADYIRPKPNGQVPLFT